MQCRGQATVLLIRAGDLITDRVHTLSAMEIERGECAAVVLAGLIGRQALFNTAAIRIAGRLRFRDNFSQLAGHGCVKLRAAKASQGLRLWRPCWRSEYGAE